MTRAEKADILRQKAFALIKTFEGIKLPAVPFKLNAWTSVFDIHKYISTNTAVLNSDHDPFSRPYVMAYLRLSDLKKYIDELGKTDSQPSPVQDSAKPGS